MLARGSELDDLLWLQLTRSCQCRAVNSLEKCIWSAGYLLHRLCGRRVSLRSLVQGCACGLRFLSTGRSAFTEARTETLRREDRSRVRRHCELGELCFLRCGRVTPLGDIGHGYRRHGPGVASTMDHGSRRGCPLSSLSPRCTYLQHTVFDVARQWVLIVKSMLERVAMYPLPRLLPHLSTSARFFRSPAFRRCQ
jgi:hypothetical protein